MDWFIGEIRIFAPILQQSEVHWLPCDGRLLEITRYQALYALLSTAFGGDGKKTFGIPDLRGRAIVGANGSFGSGSSYPVGGKGGLPKVPLTEAQLPMHNHDMQVAAVPGTTTALAGTVYAEPTSPLVQPLYTDFRAPLVDMDPDTVKPVGGSLPHENMQPSTALNYYIAVIGIWPPRP
ncbi:phage tail protein [Sphingomonas pokkalii]|uniref:Phage tail protein n=1 Tax=Sphingomonas pokkalii TaxID=2175090 RepID=A0A2U0SG91_9SPHN|nr:tail fiber protein [Sphingomonas pokkalii]PVX30389.1 phage tail protein [Sphingomonas pokkalii]